MVAAATTPRQLRAWAALLWCSLAAAAPCRAALVEHQLTVAEGEVRLTGSPARAVTLNGGIPGPTLRFTEGDTARIRVTNRLAEPTSIHWHGVLVPPGMDGVPWVSFPPIAPGATFTYEFPIRQHGTYWYHSHSGLQEQRGVYGAIVIAPRDGGRPFDRDHVLLLSDWTDEDPAEVLRTLKSGSHAYALAKGSAQSLVGAATAGLLGDFFASQLQRMPPMDIADVAYDRFLANGSPATDLPATGLDTVRLRVVNGSATTYFHVEFAGGPLTIVAADGQDVEPVEVRRLLVGVAETYDLVLIAPPEGSWEIRATAHDGSSHASAWLGEGLRHPAPEIPRPNIYRAMGGLGLAQLLALTPQGAIGMPDAAVDAGRFDAPGTGHAGHAGHAGHDAHAGHGGHDVAAPTGAGDHAAHAAHAPGDAAPREEPPLADRPEPPSGKRGERDFRLLGADAASAPALAEEPSAERPWPPYAQLRATRDTAPPAGRPVRTVRLTLDGDMERYVWTLNGRALWEEDTIPVRGGEVVRFVLINRTMMHHPMHLHGHFFRVINGQGERAPLKHTVDVAPMATTVIEFAADERGDWLFHCHLLYHMESGMARVVRYEGFAAGPALGAARGSVHEDHWHAWAEVTAFSSLIEATATLARTRTLLALDAAAGWSAADRPWEALATAERSVDAFTSVFAGARARGGRGRNDAVLGVVGARYVLPLMVRAGLWVDAEGETRLTLGRELPLLPRLDLRAEAAWDSREGWEGAATLSWTLGRRLALAGGWHAGLGWGAGLSLIY